MNTCPHALEKLKRLWFMQLVSNYWYVMFIACLVTKDRRIFALAKLRFLHRHPTLYKVILQPDGSSKYSPMWGQTRIYYNFPTLKKGTGPGTYVEPFPENFEVSLVLVAFTQLAKRVTNVVVPITTDGSWQSC